MKASFFFLFFLLFLSGCIRTRVHPDILILYTNDEHGHLEESSSQWHKAVQVTEAWEKEKAACPSCAVFVFSGGDNFTGSAISSVVKGESVAKFMNIVGYDASAAGNHEFDYGAKQWRRNAQLSGVPYLAANIVTPRHDIPIQPATTVSHRGVSLLVIGLTTEQLLTVTAASKIKDISLIPSAEAVKKVLSHDTTHPFVLLLHQTKKAAQQWVPLLPRQPLVVFNGHTHKEYAEQYRGVYYIQASSALKKYAVVRLTWKQGSYHVINAVLKTIPKQKKIVSKQAKKVEKLVEKYRGIVKKRAGLPLIPVTQFMSRNTFMKIHMCALLAEYSNTDIAISNPGGYRDDIHPGMMKELDLISVLPFENQVVIAKIKGEYLPANLKKAEHAVCGAVYKNGTWFIHNKPLENDHYYTVVIQDFIRDGGDGFTFSQPSTTLKTLDIPWRLPIIRFLRKQSAEGRSLNSSIDRRNR